MGRRKKIKTSASDHFDIGLIGRIQLEKQLDSLEPNMKKKALRSAVRQCAKQVQTMARIFAPVDRGNIKKAIQVRSLKKSKAYKRRTPFHKLILGAVVTIRSDNKNFDTGEGDYLYAVAQELGWKTRGKKNKKEGKAYLRRALYHNEKLIQRIFRKAIIDYIKTIPAKMAKKGPVKKEFYDAAANVENIYSNKRSI